jgi:hypothetical protein
VAPSTYVDGLFPFEEFFLLVSSVFTNDQTSKDLTQDFGQIKTKSFLSLFFHMQKYADEKTDLMKFESLLFAEERHKRKK